MIKMFFVKMMFRVKISFSCMKVKNDQYFLFSSSLESPLRSIGGLKTVVTQAWVCSR